MLQYHMGWLDTRLKPSKGQAGKRLRPILCLLACEAAGGVIEPCLPAAAGIETLHNFSLLHDDIEDRSETRRGRPTVWKLWGEPQAINAGDGMFALAHLALARVVDRGVPAGRTLAAMRIFDETCVALTQGQHLDIDFEERLDVTMDAYMTMIEGKTAALFAASLHLGAFLTGVKAPTAESYRDIGHHLGLAFQIQDDVLGIWGDAAVTGKSASSDIETRKKTLPVVYGLERSSELRELYEQEAIGGAQVNEVVSILDELGAQDMAEALAQHHHQMALAALRRSGASGEAAEAIRELAQSLLGRTT
jgi:geranylgeranyl diphosphate synthase type I